MPKIIALFCSLLMSSTALAETKPSTLWCHGDTPTGEKFYFQGSIDMQETVGGEKALLGPVVVSWGRKNIHYETNDKQNQASSDNGLSIIDPENQVVVVTLSKNAKSSVSGAYSVLSATSGTFKQEAWAMPGYVFQAKVYGTSPVAFEEGRSSEISNSGKSYIEVSCHISN